MAGKPPKVANIPDSLINRNKPDIRFSCAHDDSPTILILVSSMGHNTIEAAPPAMTEANNRLITFDGVVFWKIFLKLSYKPNFNAPSIPYPTTVGPVY